MLNTLKAVISDQYNRITNHPIPDLYSNIISTYRELPIYTDKIPNSKEVEKILNDKDSSLSERGVYFLIFMEHLGRLTLDPITGYKGPIIIKSNIEKVSEALGGTGIKIEEELEILSLWPSYSDGELLKAYLSILLKIQALEFTLSIGIDLSYRIQTEG